MEKQLQVWAHKKHGIKLSQKHLIIFRFSGGVIVTPAGSLTSIYNFSSPELMAKVKH